MKANVNTDSFVILRQRGWFPFAGKHDVPFAGRRTFNGAGFNISLNWSMQDNLNIAYLGKPQDIAVKTKSALRKGEAVIAAFAAKTGITGLFASFDPAEKCFEGKVNANSNILQNLRMDTGKRRTLFFKGRKRSVLFIQGQGFLFLFPCILSLSKEMIEQPAALFKPLTHYAVLLFSWINAVLESFTHKWFTRLNCITLLGRRQGRLSSHP